MYYRTQRVADNQPSFSRIGQKPLGESCHSPMKKNGRLAIGHFLMTLRSRIRKCRFETYLRWHNIRRRRGSRKFATPARQLRLDYHPSQYLLMQGHYQHHQSKLPPPQPRRNYPCCLHWGSTPGRNLMPKCFERHRCHSRRQHTADRLGLLSNGRGGSGRASRGGYCDHAGLGSDDDRRPDGPGSDDQPDGP